MPTCSRFFPPSHVGFFSAGRNPAEFFLSVSRHSREGSMNDEASRRISLPTHDYTAAIQAAVSWLGKRYLLATPINGVRHVNGASRPILPNDRMRSPESGARSAP